MNTSLLDDPHLFEQVRSMRRQGQRPLIVIPAGSEVIPAKLPPKCGRKRTIPRGETKHYHWYMKTPLGNAMRCRNHGCNRQLRRNDKRLTCSKKCRDELLDWCKLVVEIEEGRLDAREFPPHLRSQRNPRRRKQCASETASRE